MISILILTKNEEQDLPACLASVKWCDDVHVFDSFSTDRTVDIAVAEGATVTQRQFDGYASQRNAALNEINYKYPWIFILDADEHIPAALVAVLQQELRVVAEQVSGFRIRRRDYLNGTWLKRAQISPKYIRLVRRGKAQYHREINEVLQVEGEIKEIDAHFDHYPFSKGITHWLNKHNVYSSMEAQRWIEENKGGVHFSLQQALFNRDFSQRRYHQKGIFYKLPARYLLKWIYIVFVRGAFLDGSAGLMYASLQTIYEYFIIIKTRELLRVQEYKS